jgi:hypothetical protein
MAASTESGNAAGLAEAPAVPLEALVTLPGISGTFDGDIDTKTKSTRLAVGLSPQGLPPQFWQRPTKQDK